ncbi:CopG family transcriptional regulator [Streptomyces antimycoticus]|uniref:CopG family transcriptional regulator n=1 Tax=Streptomyces antimycoticus TaxID=68175 RepID=A0A4D4KFY4_9ACTN|nr:CopG family transcriptional regulator [Streptomyces antimycoticus]GDY45498.1 hypothetical protein SANT12839_063800 [Streptomyces antimycoticus]
MPQDIAETAYARSAPSGLSAYVTRQIERDNLNELISIAEAEHGLINEKETQAKRKQLMHAREQQLGG